MEARMRIHAYCIGWQIADTIRFTIQHYKAFCERVVFYDNYSTDDTVKIALECGAEIRYFGEPGVLNDQHYLDVKNHCWKESLADWVIVVDDDEILLFGATLAPTYVPPLQGTILRPHGFEIYDYALPMHRFTELRKGVPNSNYSKVCMWNPREVKEIDYVWGCHQARPTGNIQWVNPGERDHEKIRLLHYRSVGGPERIVNRHAMYRAKKISDVNLKWGLGSHYWNQTDEQRRANWLQDYDRRDYFSLYDKTFNQS